MTETPDCVVTEGRAYHAGDVVLLRVKGRPTADFYAHARAYLAPLEEKTGVKFVLLDDSVEVVEPSEVVEPIPGTRSAADWIRVDPGARKAFDAWRWDNT